MTDLYPWLQAAQSQLDEAWKADRMPHALLLLGVQGLGQEALVDGLLQRVLCPQASMSSAQSTACRWLEEGSHPDVLRVKVAEDKTVVTIDQIRQVTAFLQQSSHQGGYKLVVLEQADYMQLNARDALLKSLEEPNPNTLIILMAQTEGRLSRTLVSRCRTLHLPLPKLEQVWPWAQTQGFSDLQDFRQALLRAGGAPLKALDWLSAEKRKAWTDWDAQLSALITGKIDPLAIAERWTGEAFVGEWMELWVTEQIKQRLAAQQVTKGQWFELQAAVEGFRWKWERTTLNKSLLLQAWLIEMTQKGLNT